MRHVWTVLVCLLLAGRCLADTVSIPANNVPGDCSNWLTLQAGKLPFQGLQDAHFVKDGDLLSLSITGSAAAIDTVRQFLKAAEDTPLKRLQFAFRVIYTKTPEELLGLAESPLKLTLAGGQTVEVPTAMNTWPQTPPVWADMVAVNPAVDMAPLKPELESGAAAIINELRVTTFESEPTIFGFETGVPDGHLSISIEGRTGADGLVTARAVFDETLEDARALHASVQWRAKLGQTAAIGVIPAGESVPAKIVWLVTITQPEETPAAAK